jgi:RHS repeat-associated protein
VDPLGTAATYSFDAMNRETGMTSAAGTAMAGVTTMGYDAAGNQTTVTNPADETTTTTYDALDRVSTVENADTGSTTYVYDHDGRLQVLIDPDSNRTTYSYNSVGDQTEVTSPSVNSGSGVSATFVYDADHELVDTTDADGRRTTYSYDQLGRETGETWLSGGTAIAHVTFAYDADGEMTGADNANATVTFSYDNGGNLLTEATSGPGTGQPTVTLTYSHDPSGDITSVSDSLTGSGATGQGITTYVYDHALRLTTITQSAGGTTGPEVTMSYDAAGLITQTVFSNDGIGNIVKTKYMYDSAENLTTIMSYFTLEGTTFSPSPYAVEDDSYNADQQLTGISITGIGSGASNAYSYDSDSQLTGSSGTSNITYGYDANGNQNTTGYTTGAGNEMTHSPGVTYTYDNDGNTITATNSSGTTTYTYDFENRLTNVEIDGTVSATYTYDALGRRIGIDDSGTQTWTVFNGNTADDNPYADFTASGSLQTRYLDGLAVDELFARTSASGITAWYLRDNVGSFYADVTTTMVLDAVIYDPYGNIVTETNATDGDRFKFAGMEYDSVTGLYYDHARYYDAAIGRFVSQDPRAFKGGNTNLYAYVDNSPTTISDPSGEIPIFSLAQAYSAASSNLSGGNNLFQHLPYWYDRPPILIAKSIGVPLGWMNTLPPVPPGYIGTIGQDELGWYRLIRQP